MRWDDGVSWYLDVIEPPDSEPVTLEYLRDQHLRTPNENVEHEPGTRQPGTWNYRDSNNPVLSPSDVF